MASIALAARFLSLGVLWSCRISLWVWNDGTQTSSRSQIGQGAPELPPQRRLGGKVNCGRGGLRNPFAGRIVARCVGSGGLTYHASRLNYRMICV
jgi:hypothetical protein